MTLPFSLDASDLTLRPAFLSLPPPGWGGAGPRARRPGTQRRRGTTWKFLGAHDVEATGLPRRGALVPARDDGAVSLTPSLLGSYLVKVDGRTETRVAAPGERELDLRPRPAASTNPGAAVGERRASVDASGEVALALLALMALEMGLRLWTRRPLAT